MDGKIVLITGAGSGIGRAASLAFVEAGASVVIADIREKNGLETVKEINSVNGKAIFIAADVSVESDIKTLIDSVVATYGRLDYAFNNAGITGKMGTTTTCTEENWDHMTQVHLKGVWLCMKHEILQMEMQGSGAIVNSASVGGLVGFSGNAAYVAAKHGIVGLTKAAAVEYAGVGIRVNAICPGFIRTPMVDHLISINAIDQAEVIQQHPIGRMGTPDEVAEAVVWLCSESASFITGHALAVDGGYLAQ
jgi:NAD(P)-dependent dehydrogenase (short-subunit alcohol dehydrogenase family)